MRVTQAPTTTLRQNVGAVTGIHDDNYPPNVLAALEQFILDNYGDVPFPEGPNPIVWTRDVPLSFVIKHVTYRTSIATDNGVPVLYEPPIEVSFGQGDGFTVVQVVLPGGGSDVWALDFEMLFEWGQPD